ncbi:MAG: thiol oxidoreductase, partial [Bacteroidetes bacterium]|nr:thiol oxidoreductase [Bacteroidota bacterium]
EWKTPPLWGLGLSKDAQGGSYFLIHDGRALSIEAAILLHGGEAEQAKSKYAQLSEIEKQQLIAFLESL